MKRFLAFCLLACLIIIPHAAFAEDGSASVRVGYYENEIFQEGAEENAVKKGYAYEYYRKLAEYTGWKYEYVYGQYADLYQMLLNGKIDMLAGLAKTDERADVIGYPDDAMGSETYNLVKHTSDADVTANPATLENKRIGVLEGAMAGALNQFLEKHGVTASVIVFPDYQHMLDAFDDLSLDVIAAEGNGTYGRSHAEHLCSFGASAYYLCVNAQRPDLLAALNRAQEQLMAEEPNYLYSLRIKYYPATISSRAFSEAEKAWIGTNRSLRIGYLNHYRPYSDTDDKGNVTGLIKELISDMLEGLGLQNLEVSYKSYDNYDEMIADVGHERIDVAFPVGGGLFFLEESGIYASNAVLSSRTELVYKGTYSERTVSSVAFNENNRMQYYYAKTVFPDAEMIPCPSIEACLDAVLTGKASCTVLDGLRANSILKNRRFRELSQKPLVQNDDCFFGVRIGNEGLLKLINRGANIVGQDRAEKLAYKYVDGLYSYTFLDMLMDNQWLLAVLVAALAILATLFFARESRQSKERMLHVVASLAEAIDAKDTYTNGHSGRVAEYSREIAKRFGYDEEAQNTIYMMGLLHDVGKIGVPDAVINKPGRLTDEEFGLIKKHPVIGGRILGNIQEMPTLSAGARWHHERYDGRGYPDGLSGQDIPEESRIIAVADAYDAMSSNRSYRSTLPQETIRAEIEKGKGTQFDPKFADIMLKMIDEDVDFKMRDHH